MASNKRGADVIVEILRGQPLLGGVRQAFGDMLGELADVRGDFRAAFYTGSGH